MTLKLVIVSPASLAFFQDSRNQSFCRFYWLTDWQICWLDDSESGPRYLLKLKDVLGRYSSVCF